MIKQGKLRGEKVQYDDGIGCCVWEPFPDEKDDSFGLCWDFSFSDIEDLQKLIETLKAISPERIVHVEDGQPKPEKRTLLCLVRKLLHDIGWWLVSL